MFDRGRAGSCLESCEGEMSGEGLSRRALLGGSVYATMGAGAIDFVARAAKGAEDRGVPEASARVDGAPAASAVALRAPPAQAPSAPATRPKVPRRPTSTTPDSRPRSARESQPAMRLNNKAAAACRKTSHPLIGRRSIASQRMVQLAASLVSPWERPSRRRASRGSSGPGGLGLTRAAFARGYRCARAFDLL